MVEVSPIRMIYLTVQYLLRLDNDVTFAHLYTTEAGGRCHHSAGLRLGHPFRHVSPGAPSRSGQAHRSGPDISHGPRAPRGEMRALSRVGNLSIFFFSLILPFLPLTAFLPSCLFIFFTTVD